MAPPSLAVAPPLAPPHRSWPIFTSSSYKSQVIILHTFSLNLSSRFGFLNDGFNYWFISIECVSRIGFFFIPSPFSLNLSSRFGPIWLGFSFFLFFFSKNFGAVMLWNLNWNFVIGRFELQIKPLASIFPPMETPCENFPLKNSSASL